MLISCFEHVVSERRELVVFALHSEVGDHHEEVAQVIDVRSHVLDAWDQLRGHHCLREVVSI